jgi:hypothetical protein
MLRKTTGTGMRGKVSWIQARLSPISGTAQMMPSRCLESYVLNMLDI